MRVQFTRAGIVLAAAIAGSIAGGSAPVAATELAPSAAAESQWAWVTNRNPGASHAPDPWNRGNSSGGINTVSRAGRGDWTVSFPGLGAPAAHGVAFVTPLASRVGCQTFDPVTTGGTTSVRVTCIGGDEDPIDAPFSLTYLHAKGGMQGGALAYFLAQDPQGSNDTPVVRNSYNSSGGTNRAIDLDYWHYRVTFGGLGTSKGHIQVSTAYTAGSPQHGYCHAGKWSNVAGDAVADVYCYEFTGHPSDASFTVAFMKGVGLKGAGGSNVAYLNANQQHLETAYHPAPKFSLNGAGRTNTVVRNSRGRYTVTIPGMKRGGAVAVTVLHAGSNNTCAVASIRTTPPYQVIVVQCFKNGSSHDPSDTRFLLAYEK
jgi:hypothetical protein